MAEQATFYSESFTIRANEVDQHGNCTLSSIFQLFQEVAGNHALLLNFDITDLHTKGLTWVLHRMDIQILTYPKWRDKITIETWPATGDALRAYRNYRIINENGQELGVCLSYWMMMNIKTRRPTRMPREVLETRLENREHVLEVSTGKIPSLSNVDQEFRFRVRKADLDMNRHVNNAIYVQWIEETIDFNQGTKIKRMDISFIKECKFGDVIYSQKEQAESSKSLHLLKNQSDELVAQASIITN